MSETESGLPELPSDICDKLEDALRWNADIDRQVSSGDVGMGFFAAHQSTYNANEKYINSINVLLYKTPSDRKYWYLIPYIKKQKETERKKQEQRAAYQELQEIQQQKRRDEEQKRKDEELRQKEKEERALAEALQKEREERLEKERLQKTFDETDTGQYMKAVADLKRISNYKQKTENEMAQIEAQIQNLTHELKSKKNTLAAYTEEISNLQTTVEKLKRGLSMHNQMQWESVNRLLTLMQHVIES